MRTRNVTQTLYKFEELSASAKDRAKQNHAALCGYAWADESLASIRALAAHFDGKLAGYEVDWSDSMPCAPPTFEMPEMEPDYIEARLATLGRFNPQTLKGLGDCVLTGYCMDESAIDGLRAAWHGGERDLGKLMGAAYASWLRDCHADYAAQYGTRNFAETCDANSWEFFENGELA